MAIKRARRPTDPVGAEATQDRRTGGILDRKVRRRLLVTALVAAVMVVLLAVRVWQGEVGLGSAAISLVVGAGVGLLSARMTILQWDAEAQSVVGRMDLLGAVVLGLYVVFILTKNRIVGHWVESADEVAAIGVGLTAGAMLGRTVAGLRGIKRALAVGGRWPLGQKPGTG